MCSASVVSLIGLVAGVLLTVPLYMSLCFHLDLFSDYLFIIYILFPVVHLVFFLLFSLIILMITYKKKKKKMLLHVYIVYNSLEALRRLGNETELDENMCRRCT